jgi:hypothetical protein
MRRSRPSWAPKSAGANRNAPFTPTGDDIDVFGNHRATGGFGTSIAHRLAFLGRKLLVQGKDAIVPLFSRILPRKLMEELAFRSLIGNIERIH